MKVYRVMAEVEAEFYVAAESQDEADDVAEEYAEQAIEDANTFPRTGIPCQVFDPSNVPASWRNSIPYGDNHGDQTIAQILTAPEPEPAEVKDEWTIPMFAADSASEGKKAG